MPSSEPTQTPDPVVSEEPDVLPDAADFTSFYKWLKHPFFRLDRNLGLDREDIQREAASPFDTPSEHSFKKFVKNEMPMLGVLREKSKTESLIRTRFDKLYAKFSDYLPFYMQLEPGERRVAAANKNFGRAIEMLDELALHRREKDLDEFCSEILRELAITIMRAKEGHPNDEIVSSYLDVFESKARQLVSRPPEPASPFRDWDFHILASTHLTGFCLTQAILHKVEKDYFQSIFLYFLKLKKQAGTRWRQLEPKVRFKFALVCVYYLTILYGDDDSIGPKGAVNAETLYLIRDVFTDAIYALSLESASPYHPLFRYFISKIDKKSRISWPLKIINTQTFTETEQFEMMRLVERFRQYRQPVTLDKLADYLRQFKDPRDMSLALRILRQVKFYTLGNLQSMLEDAFRKVENYESVSTIVPLADVGGSTSLMMYLATHWSLPEVKVSPVVDDALEKISEGSPLCFLEDIAVSGIQTFDIFKELLGVRFADTSQNEYCKRVKDPDRLKKMPIRLIYAIATDHAVLDLPQKLSELGFDDVQVLCCELEPLGQKVFETTMCHSWQSPTQQKEAEQLFRRIGYDILASTVEEDGWDEHKRQDRCLGYGNKQKLIVFEYNLPKSTLTALWKEGTYLDRPWSPLFPHAG